MTTTTDAGDFGGDDECAGHREADEQSEDVGTLLRLGVVTKAALQLVTFKMMVGQGCSGSDPQGVSAWRFGYNPPPTHPSGAQKRV